MENILYYSTNLKTHAISFKEALLKGLAPDKGLFMPESIPSIDRNDLKALKGKSYPDTAKVIARKFLAAEIDQEDLEKLIEDAYNYPVPLENVHEKKYILRLDQGPTASFKDFAARLMARLMNYFMRDENKNLTILTATSGDTGSAIANAFYGLENIRVVILFPEKEVTDRQRKQMTTLQKNIKTLAVDGKFDDCQAMVKEAFADHELNYLNLSSANSINIGRLIPQSFYYFHAYCQLADNPGEEEVVFSVPSGNFGDLMGGMLAKEMGLPVKRFVVSTNKNDEFPVFMQSGDYHIISPSINCISSAMNVGHPSNMSRLFAIYGGIMNEKGEVVKEPDFTRMQGEIFSSSIDDNETRETIKETWEKYKVLLEPHGAVGWAGLQRNFSINKADADPGQLSICLETAHPAKFPVEINNILGYDPQLPKSLENLEEKKEFYERVSNKYLDFKEYLKTHF
jgi:threonine synthase